MPDIDPRAKRDRLARNPGGMVCEKCSEVFIGEEWHQFCALCVAEIAANDLYT
jgi:Zn finger protein HypA/HybF involved in hydrogenase expression